MVLFGGIALGLVLAMGAIALGLSVGFVVAGLLIGWPGVGIACQLWDHFRYGG
jgi:hypothetical protein